MKTAIVIGLLALSACYQQIDTVAYGECEDGQCRCEDSARTCCDPNVCGYDADDACSAVCEPGHEQRGIRSFDIGDSYWCSIDDAGALVCQEYAFFGSEAAVAPEGRFVQVSVAEGYACAVREDGVAVCWYPEFGNAQEMAADVVAVESTSSVFDVSQPPATAACGLRADGSIECWGQTLGGDLQPPAGTYRAFVEGAAFCALDVRDEVVCWASQAGYQPPQGPWAAASLRLGAFCGRRASGRVECPNYDGENPDGVFIDVVPFCGVKEDGWLSCWDRPEESSPLPLGRFVELEGDSDSGCALRASGELACWGDLNR